MSPNQSQAIEIIISGVLHKLQDFIASHSDDLSWINEIDAKTGYSMLHVACTEERIEIIEYILSIDTIDVNIQGVNKNTSLILATKHNRIDIIQLLLNKGCDVDMAGHDGNTALLTACLYEYTDIIKLLLAHNANIHIQNVHSDNSLTLSLKYGYLAQAKLFISKGSDINIIYPVAKMNILMHMLFHKNHQVAHFIIQNNIDLSHRSSSGFTALYYSCIYEVFNISDILIKDYKCDVNTTDSGRRTILMYACMNKKYDLIEYCLKHSIDVNAQDIWGYTAIMFVINSEGDLNKQKISSVKYNQVLQIIQLLLTKSHDLNVCDRKNNTVLCYACANGYDFDILRLFIEHGANPNYSLEDKSTPLDLIQSSSIRAKMSLTCS